MIGTLVLVGLLVPAGDRPAPVLQPQVPPIELGEDRPSPRGGTIDRDGHVAERFTAEGQVARYTFEANKGELSLFDVGTWGYSRGWKCRAGLKILNEGGKTLAASRRRGGTTSRLFTAFVAPETGTYTLELSAEEQYYRYTVVRHCGYRRTAHRTHGGRGAEHGHLRGPKASQSWRIPVKAGSWTQVRVTPTHPEAKKLANQSRAADVGGVIRRANIRPSAEADADGAPQEGSTRRDLRRAQGLAFPFLVLDLVSTSGEPIERGVHSALWLPTEDGEVIATVRVSEGDLGVLYDLVVEPAVELARVRGYVGDLDDEPVAGVRVHLVHEARIDHVGSTTTSADGSWIAEVPPGRYTILQEAPDGTQEAIHVAVAADGSTEVNTIIER